MGGRPSAPPPDRAAKPPLGAARLKPGAKGKEHWAPGRQPAPAAPPTWVGASYAAVAKKAAKPPEPSPKPPAPTPAAPTPAAPSPTGATPKAKLHPRPQRPTTPGGAGLLPPLPPGVDSAALPPELRWQLATLHEQHKQMLQQMQAALNESVAQLLAGVPGPSAPAPWAPNPEIGRAHV